MILSRQFSSYSSELEHCQATLSRREIYILHRIHPGDKTYTCAHADTHVPNAHSHASLSVNLFVYLTVLFQYKSLGPALERICLPLTGWFYPLSLLPSYKNSDFAERFGSCGKSKTAIYRYNLSAVHLSLSARMHVYDRKNGFIIVVVSYRRASEKRV